MSDHLFLYRMKDSDDRDCCAYIDAAGPKFVCDHYFSSVNICGSCYAGGKFPEYEKIETILTKYEYAEILAFNTLINALGYGITKGDFRYRKGMKLIDSIKHIYDKLKSDKAILFFKKIQESEMEYLKEEYALSDSDLEDIFNKYTEDYRDRSVVSYVYDSNDSLGYNEAYELGYMNSNSVTSQYFDYKKFGKDLVEDDDRYLELYDGRVARLNY